jgi:hypothetical protein
MRVFLCPYGGFSLAIPMDAVLSVTLHRNNPEKTIEYNQENFNTYISLPLLFNFENRELSHGIILKDGSDEQLENKYVLLSYKIESEAELSAKKIYPLPESFSAMKFSNFFTGIVFYNRSQNEKTPSGIYPQELVLLLDPPHIVNYIKKEIKA